MSEQSERPSSQSNLKSKKKVFFDRFKLTLLVLQIKYMLGEELLLVKKLTERELKTGVISKTAPYDYFFQHEIRFALRTDWSLTAGPSQFGWVILLVSASLVVAHELGSRILLEEAVQLNEKVGLKVVAVLQKVALALRAFFQRESHIWSLNP